VLLSALEDIIQDVIVEREQELEQEQGGMGAAAAARERERDRERESPLREAVRAWIESLDLVGGDGSHS
jgi:6-phosphofructokinase